ncbi:class I poly(R)-hydroxyalkanoic acid synthase [Hyphobacterium marinum]|uniref:Class I poly(R)-hydroxyalkanoic acid synthase n=1 Tax=Hyphobacterium marinum TaxID=3116574 RepID=A0ABU7LYL7_9PROT|nr:class I poly(R)-hydroxyalkanoic acid synthase [Hyphobacterium sp. Y6023]MEE2566651.1 class I poly(R)-hydroxyalkanoic acid synthase [Hyphobacterium sp. Y6023]
MAETPKRPRKTKAATKPKPAAAQKTSAAKKTAPRKAAAKKPAPKPAAAKAAPKPTPGAQQDWTAMSAPDLETLDHISRNLMQASLNSQKLMSDVMRQALAGDPMMPQTEQANNAPEFGAVWTEILTHPEKLMDAQAGLMRGYLDLWSSTTRKVVAGEAEEVVTPDPGDKRWRSEDWSKHPLFDAIKQSYLLNQNFLMGLVKNVDGVDPVAKRKVEFLTKQMVDAMAPTNFALTNPDVLRETLQTKGENLSKGLANLTRDLERGGGRLALSQTDLEGFKIGTDIATTPGKVVFRNELIELIQYEPTTETVKKRPLLIAPPWINKYYILDMRQKNSMVRWLTQQGFTVFLISWVNPDPSLKDKTFGDYIETGLFSALDAIEEATGETSVNAVGYCIGGTMLASALALLAAKGEEGRIASATFFAAQTDFELAGDLLLFVDDAWMAEIERLMDAQGGVLDGRTMSDTFNMLRSNDLVWSFVVSNYLLGRQPQAFDLLFWNADQTRMPKALHLWYLDTMYRKNRLSKGEVEIGGHTLDLGKVTVPIYMQASREDHIAPFPSVYRGAQKFGGPVNFMLAGSGHIAGVINHPEAKKYQHWVNTDLPDTVKAWLESAEEHPGSWWENWRDWLYERSGKDVPARTPGDGKLKPLCDAPGTYVLVKS